MLDAAVQVETPVGKQCLMCSRPVEPDDQGMVRYAFGPAGGYPAPIHRGCEMGTTIGHYFGVCSCTGWDDVYERGRELVRRADAGTLRPSH